MGAAAAVVIAFLGGGLDRAGLWGALVDTGVATAMIFAIIIGAEIFSNFVTVAGLTQALSVLVADLGLGPWTVMLCIVAIYMLLGCVLVGVSLAVVTGESRFDAVGSVAIGLLLGVIAVILGIEMRSLLIGEAASQAEVAA